MQTETNSPTLTRTASHSFVICGFGSLGQYCVEELRQFATEDSEIAFRIIDLNSPSEWVIDNAEAIASHLLLGDCRDPQLLKQAGIEQAQAALFVTSDELVNIQAALAARAINPVVRLIVRSSKENLNALLQTELGSFTAMNPAELPASAFVNAVVTSDLLSSFETGGGGAEFQISRHTVGASGELRPGQMIAQLEQPTRRIVAWRPAKGIAQSPPDVPTNAFYQWDAETRLTEGDVVITIQQIDPHESRSKPHKPVPENQTGNSLFSLFRHTKDWLKSLFAMPRMQPVIALGAIVGISLLILSTVLFKIAGETTWLGAFAASVVLLTGGYGDLFDPIGAPSASPAWLQIYGLVVTGISLVFLLGVLGLIADAVVRSRLEFLRRRVPIPAANHLVIIGYKRLARKATEILKKIKQPFVVLSLSEEDLTETMDPNIPVVKSTIEAAISSVRLDTARGIMLLTEDELLNLELALRVKAFSRERSLPLSVVVRVFDNRFSQDARQIIPDAQVLSAYQLAGQAFAASALGEQILGLVQTADHSIFVADYEVDANRHLTNRLIGSIAYGFGVIPVFLRRCPDSTHERKSITFPGDDLRLEAGDHLTVLVTINGLRRIEHGEFSPPRRWT
ncbi:MAG TPA: NAD-binding protein, partial [Planctomycetaceae bacterium]|nr:NAD-binding protein [Planctomycetaceae bacterium]